jgi:hypothetical protein
MAIKIEAKIAGANDFCVTGRHYDESVYLLARAVIDKALESFKLERFNQSIFLSIEGAAITNVLRHLASEGYAITIQER